MDDLIYRQGTINEIESLLDKTAKGDIGIFYNKILKLAIEHIQKMPSARRWISCNEALPNKDGNYIVTLSYTEGFKFSFVDIDNFSVYDRQWDTYGNEVSAWMPLPQPWEEVKDG